jgi:glutathione S-transferase
VLVGAALMWAERAELLKEHDSLKHYADRLRSRPAYQRASKD